MAKENMAIFEDKAPVNVQSDLSIDGVAKTCVDDSKVPGTEKGKTVTFETLKDPLDPLNWSSTYKWLAVALVSMSTTIV